MKIRRWAAVLLLPGMLYADTAPLASEPMTPASAQAPSTSASDKAQADAKTDTEDTYSQLTGTVTRVDEALRSLQVRGDDGQTYRFYAAAGTPIYDLTNETQEFHKLQPNDRVQVRFDPNGMRAKEISELKSRVR